MNHHEADAIVIDSSGSEAESHTESEGESEGGGVEEVQAGVQAGHREAKGKGKVQGRSEVKGKRRRFAESKGGASGEDVVLLGFQAKGQSHDEGEGEGGSGAGIAAPAPTSALTRSERKALEDARRERQRARRRMAGLPSDSEGEGEGEGAGEQDEAPVSSQRPVKPLPGSSNYKSRSYVTESDGAQQRDVKPAKGKTRAAAAYTYVDDAPTGASTSTHAATVGLGSGAKPALRRVLGEERFWTGSVKRSYNRYTGDGVPLSDLILPTTRHNPAGLTHAVVASYCYDFDWLAGILPSRTAAQPGRNAPSGPELTFILLEQASSGGGGPAAGVHQLAVPGWVALVIKNLGREYTCQHMKFLLLFYADRLRLCILTGNLIPSDWSVLENAAFIQDFALLPRNQRDTASDTYDQLSAILRSLSLPPGHAAVKNLARYDLSQGPTIVASLASQYPIRGWDAVRKTGLGRLAAQVPTLLGGGGSSSGSSGPAAGHPVELEVHGSSMGSYSLRWLQQFHLAASGLSGALPLPKSDAAASKQYRSRVHVHVPGTAPPPPPPPLPPIKILFPTRDFVERESAAGAPGGGCHFGKPGAVDKFGSMLYHARAARHAGVLMHQKGILALREGARGVPRDEWLGAGGGAHSEDRDATGAEIVGYTYLGSANFTMNAWGNISVPSGSAGGGGGGGSTAASPVQMTANNWELGVLLPLARADLSPAAELSSNARSAVPWCRPARRYEAGDVPWSATG